MAESSAAVKARVRMDSLSTTVVALLWSAATMLVRKHNRNPVIQRIEEEMESHDECFMVGIVMRRSKKYDGSDSPARKISRRRDDEKIHFWVQ